MSWSKLSFNFGMKVWSSHCADGQDKGGTDRVLFCFISQNSHFCTTSVPKQILNAWHTLLDIGLWMWNAFYSETFMFFLEVAQIDFQSIWMKFSSRKISSIKILVWDIQKNADFCCQRMHFVCKISSPPLPISYSPGARTRPSKVSLFKVIKLCGGAAEAHLSEIIGMDIESRTC